MVKEAIEKGEEVDKVEKDVKVHVRQRSVGGGHIYVGGGVDMNILAIFVGRKSSMPEICHAIFFIHLEFDEIPWCRFKR